MYVNTLGRILTLAAWAAVPVWAQGTATLTVRVTDPASSAIPGASVTLENPVTGLRRVAVTDDDGTARFANIPFQAYDLATLKGGFREDRRSLNLRSNVPVHTAVTLGLADQVTSVDVVAETLTIIDPTATGSRTELNTLAMERMPISPATRGLEGVLLSMPGFAANANGAIHPRGAHNQMTFVIDGMPISDQLTGAFANAIDPTIVESIDLYTGNVPAEFGNKVSGVAVVTTKTGRNSDGKIHGNVQAVATGFDTYGTLAQIDGGTEKLGYFASFNATKSNRYLDTVSLDNLHNGGNAERAYARADYQLTPSDIIRASVMAGRSSFQLANLRSQHANLQDQRQAMEDISTSVGWIRTLSPSSTFETQASFRNAFARLFPSDGDTPVTAHQARRLSTWNFGARYNRVRGRHNFRGGVDFQRFPVRENFSFAITSPTFNDPSSPGYIETLTAHDLTRGGDWFRFHETNAGSLSSAWIQDQISAGRFQFSLGLRYDYYRFLARGAQWQPRVGMSYHIKETATVLRASYNRTYQTPPNENLLLSNSPEAGALAPPAVREQFNGGTIAIRPERQNVYELGVQQALGPNIGITATYYHKNATDLQDNDNFLNTGIIFPTSLASSRINGAEGRVTLFPGKRLSATVSATHARVVVNPPFTGGLFLGSAAIDSLSAGPFIIDHDQKLSIAANAVYNVTRNLWTSVIVRYDSGLVSNPSDPEVVKNDPDYADQLPYVKLTTDPPRVNPRTITDLAVGYTHTADTQKKWEAVFQVSNVANVTALYNFQSIFVGTRVVSPRTVGVKLRWFF